MMRGGTVLGLGIAVVLLTAALVTGAASSDAESAECELTYDSFGKTFVETYCVRCHSSANKGFARKGAPAGYNFDSVGGVRKEAADIVKYAAVKKDMPPVEPKPTDEERAKVKTWIECEFK